MFTFRKARWARPKKPERKSQNYCTKKMKIWDGQNNSLSISNQIEVEIRLFYGISYDHAQTIVHPIFSSFDFWYFGHFRFSFLFFPSCPSCLAKCKQRLRNIFVLL